MLAPLVKKQLPATVVLAATALRLQLFQSRGSV